MVVPVRKFACGNLECKFFGSLKDSDIWPAMCCEEFIWPSIQCGGCGKDFVTAEERDVEVIHGWMPGIAQFGAGPYTSREADEAGVRALEDNYKSAD